MRLGAVELKVQRNVQYTGRKAAVGRITFDNNDRMAVQVGYCPDCKSKIIVSLDGAKTFARLFGQESAKPTARLLHLLKQKAN